LFLSSGESKILSLWYAPLYFCKAFYPKICIADINIATQPYFGLVFSALCIFFHLTLLHPYDLDIDTVEFSFLVLPGKLILMGALYNI
jgi:hypothetical protein